MIQSANKKFKVDFCMVAHWENGKITEENLFYDLVGMMGQLGLMPDTIESGCLAFVKIKIPRWVPKEIKIPAAVSLVNITQC